MSAALVVTATLIVMGTSCAESSFSPTPRDAASTTAGGSESAATEQQLRDALDATKERLKRFVIESDESGVDQSSEEFQAELQALERDIWEATLAWCEVAEQPKHCGS
jgi:hypothetical protein